MKDKIQIFIAYHKPNRLFKNKILIPIHVGREHYIMQNYKNQQDINDKKWLLKHTVGDNTGDNISLKNPNYCELTALYWIWKNTKSDYVGLFHYRRLLKLTEKGLNYTETEIKQLFNKYDIILPKKFCCEYPMKEHYYKDHRQKDFDTTINILKQKYPNYTTDIENTIHNKSFYTCNIFISKKAWADKYCNWLFDILFEVDKNIDIPNDPYQKRVFGFLSERLFNIYIAHEIRTNNLKFLEVPVINVSSDGFNSKILQNIFSIRNEGFHKVITILGIRFKKKNKIKVTKKNY